jgi:hypothetical protein
LERIARQFTDCSRDPNLILIAETHDRGELPSLLPGRHHVSFHRESARPSLASG